MEIRQSAQVAFPAFKPTDKPIGTRVGFGNALTYLAAKHPEVVATSPDLQDSVHMFDMEKIVRRHGKTNPMGAYFPEGIAESNACGKCAGLVGYEGLISFLSPPLTISFWKRPTSFSTPPLSVRSISRWGHIPAAASAPTAKARWAWPGPG